MDPCNMAARYVAHSFHNQKTKTPTVSGKLGILAWASAALYLKRVGFLVFWYMGPYPGASLDLETSRQHPPPFPLNKNVLADSEAYHGPELHFAFNTPSTGSMFFCQHVAPQAGTYKEPGAQQPKKPKLGNRSNRPFLPSLEAWHGPQLHFASSVLQPGTYKEP